MNSNLIKQLSLVMMSADKSLTLIKTSDTSVDDSVNYIYFAPVATIDIKGDGIHAYRLAKYADDRYQALWDSSSNHEALTREQLLDIVVPNLDELIERMYGLWTQDYGSYNDRDRCDMQCYTDPSNIMYTYSPFINYPDAIVIERVTNRKGKDSRDLWLNCGKSHMNDYFFDAYPHYYGIITINDVVYEFACNTKFQRDNTIIFGYMPDEYADLPGHRILHSSNLFRALDTRDNSWAWFKTTAKYAETTGGGDARTLGDCVVRNTAAEFITMETWYLGLISGITSAVLGAESNEDNKN